MNYRLLAVLYLFPVVALLFCLPAIAQEEDQEVEFIRLTCIETMGYMKIEYARFPDQGGKDSNAEWAKYGFFDAKNLSKTCNLGRSKYRISSKDRTASCRPGDCESSPIAISIANDDSAFFHDLVFGPNGENGVSVSSIELWEGFGRRGYFQSPIAITLCLSPTANEAREPCHSYNPWLDEYNLLPPLTQGDLAEFVQLRSQRASAASNGREAFERSSVWLSEFLELRYACKFPNLTLAPDVAIYAVAPGKSVRHALELPFRLDRHPRSYQIDIVVNAPGKKVALLFTGYQSVVWNIQWSPNTEIVAAASFDYRMSAFAGLPKAVPTFSGHFGSGYACRKVSRTRTIQSNLKLQPREYQLIDEMSVSIYGRTSDAVFLGDDQLVVGESLDPEVRLLQSSETPLESFNRLSPRATTEDALATAVKKGLLRPALPKDARDWISAVTASREARPVAKDWQPFLFNAYVVQQPFNLPAGLFGIYTFFVPKGVPSPRGPLGHAVILDFNSLRCSGPQDSACGYFSR